MNWIPTKQAAWIVVLLAANAALGQSVPSAPERIEFDDNFFTDTRNNYRIKGTPEWSQGAIRIPTGAYVSMEVSLIPEVEFEAHLWPSTDKSESCASRIGFVTSNGYEVVFQIARGLHEGRYYRQLVIGEARRGRAGDQTTEPAIVSEIFRTKPFTLGVDAERWKVKYHWGVIDVFCNDQRLGICKRPLNCANKPTKPIP